MPGTPTPAQVLRAVTDLAREHRFSGVVGIDPPASPEKSVPDGGAEPVRFAAGQADRAHAIPVTPATRFGIASGSKGFTALVVASLIEEGTLAMHELATTEAFVPLLDGHPQRFPPGRRFAYCNGGYVVLALLAERASGTPFHDLVTARVTGPAGMGSTGYPRSDELPGDAAVGHVHQAGAWRSNVCHLPVRGNGDGGAYSTAADLHRFWRALFAGRIVGRPLVEELVRPRQEVREGHKRYGLGFWLHPSSRVVMLIGEDAGVSFWSGHDPLSGATCTVLSNTAGGAWSLLEPLEEYLDTTVGAAT